MTQVRGDHIRFWAHCLFRNGFRLVLFHHRSKIPIPHPTTRGWWRVADDEQLAAALQWRPLVNLAIDFRESEAVAVEWDIGGGAEYAAGLGVTSNDNCWIGRSARGYRVIYRRPQFFHLGSLSTSGCPIELKSTTLLLVCPSVHPSGIPYTWVKDHSPEDFSIADLTEPPPRLLSLWHSLSTQRRHPSVNVRHAAPTSSTRAKSEALVLSLLPNAHFVDRDHRQIAGFTDPASHSKSHIWVDLEKNCFIDWHTREGGTVAGLLDLLGCANQPHVRRKRGRVIMEVRF